MNSVGDRFVMIDSFDVPSIDLIDVPSTDHNNRMRKKTTVNVSFLQ